MITHNLSNNDATLSKVVSLSFDQEHNADDWKITNDSVMGGLSVGTASIDNQSLIFRGNLSTENSGGFSSIFKELPTLTESIESVSIVIKGDGKPYQLRVRTLVMGYELAYKVNVKTTANTLSTHTFQLSDFEASFRGRTISNVPQLKAHTISHVGFLLSTKRPSDFSLTVYSINFL